MRSYHDPIEVRRGLIAGQEVPAQFLWRDRLWVVREILSHWVETGAWWEHPGVAALLEVGTGRRGGSAGADGFVSGGGVDLLGERHYWRVEARWGRAIHGSGVFDLSYDASDGQWRLVCAFD